MAPIDDQLARMNDLLAKWKTYRGSIAEPARYCQIKDDLYQVRNAGWNGNPPISSWPSELIDADDGMMAAVEHYFLCRCWVGNAIYPAWEVTAMNTIYDWGKIAGVTPRHNPNKPTTPPSALQMAAKIAGVRDGKADLQKSGKSAPFITTPPKYY
jgi:hypothetical protein